MPDSREQQASFPWRAGLESGPVEPRRRRVTREPRPVGRELESPAKPAPGLWFTAEEAATYLGLPTRKALYAAVARGQVPARRFGRRRLRFNRVELDALLGGLAKSTGVH